MRSEGWVPQREHRKPHSGCSLSMGPTSSYGLSPNVKPCQHDTSLLFNSISTTHRTSSFPPITTRQRIVPHFHSFPNFILFPLFFLHKSLFNKINAHAHAYAHVHAILLLDNPPFLFFFLFLFLFLTFRFFRWNTTLTL